MTVIKVNGKDQRLLDYADENLKESMNNDPFDYYENLFASYYINGSFDLIGEYFCFIKDSKITSALHVNIDMESNNVNYKFDYLKKDQKFVWGMSYSDIDQIKEIIDRVIREYPNIMFYNIDLNVEVTNYLKKCGYFYNENVFKFDCDVEETYINFDYLSNIMTKDRYYFKNMVLQKHEKGKILDIYTVVLNQDELISYMNNAQIVSTNGNNSYFGFHYFKPSDLNAVEESSNSERKFICAISVEDKNGVVIEKIVGVMLLTNQSYAPNFKSISYIDVNKNYRRMGIAKKIYHELNDYLSPEDTLISNSLSHMGRLVKINKVRNNIVTKCKIKDNHF